MFSPINIAAEVAARRPSQNDSVLGLHNALHQWAGKRPYEFSFPLFEEKHPYARITFREPTPAFVDDSSPPLVRLRTAFDESKAYDLYSTTRCFNALTAIVAARTERALIKKLEHYEDGYGWSGVIEMFVGVKLGPVVHDKVDFATGGAAKTSFDFGFDVWVGLYGEGYIFPTQP